MQTTRRLEPTQAPVPFITGGASGIGASLGRAPLQQVVAPQFVEKGSPGEAPDRSAFGFDGVLGNQEQLQPMIMMINPVANLAPLPEQRPQNLVHDFRVGFAAGFLHHVADEKAHQLGVAGAEASDLVGAAVDHALAGFFNN